MMTNQQKPHEYFQWALYLGEPITSFAARREKAKAEFFYPETYLFTRHDVPKKLPTQIAIAQLRMGGSLSVPIFEQIWMNPIHFYYRWVDSVKKSHKMNFSYHIDRENHVIHIKRIEPC